jgi:tRNA(Ile)-lysidine synthase
MPLVRREARTTRTRAGSSAALLRPLIGVARAGIESYAAACGLAWIEDESNDDTRYTRNWLRHDVLPLLAQRAPGVRATLARAADNMSEAAALLDDLARIDAGMAAPRSACPSPRPCPRLGARGNAGAIPLETIRALSPARAKNLLRFLIAEGGWPMPTAERLQEGLRQALEARRDAGVVVELGACELRRHAGSIYLMPRPLTRVPKDAVAWCGEDALALPGWGTLTMRRTTGSGLSAARLGSGPVTVRVRAGGERLQPACGRPRRTVKNLLQEAGLAPWERERLPYIYCGEKLVCVPGVAIDCQFQARGDEPAIVPLWRAG